MEALVKFFLSIKDIDPALMPDETMRALKNYHWPGNVRELKNLVDRSVLLNEGIIQPSHVGDGGTGPAPLSAAAVADAKSALGSITDLGSPFKEAKDRLVSAFEQAYMAALLSRAGSDPSVSELARLSGLDRKHVRTLMERYGH